MNTPLKIAALGLPGIILVVTIAAKGLTGAAIAAALAFLGSPAGMLGSIAVLGLTGLIADALTKVGLEDLLRAKLTTFFYVHPMAE